MSEPLTLLEAALAATALAAMAGLAVTDARRFEVSPPLGGVLAAAVLALLWLGGGRVAALDALVAATVAGGVTWMVTVLRPGRIGHGDIWLLAALGLVAGTSLLPLALALFMAGCVVTAAAWSAARGKRPLRSMFPGAIPAMGAAAPVLLMRLAGHGAAP